MTALAQERAVAVPEQGNLVRVRDRYWVVESVRRSALPVDPMSSNGWARHHLVRLVPIDDKGSSASLSVFWEAEPGTEIRPQSELPDPKEELDKGVLIEAGPMPSRLSSHLDLLIEQGALERVEAHSWA